MKKPENEIHAMQQQIFQPNHYAQHHVLMTTPTWPIFEYTDSNSRFFSYVVPSPSTSFVVAA